MKIRVPKIDGIHSCNQERVQSRSHEAFEFAKRQPSASGTFFGHEGTTSHKIIKSLLKRTQEESVRAFNAQLKNRREMLKPIHANMAPPFAANHFADESFSRVIDHIWRNASPCTRPWYDRGQVPGGDNWIILWMLYHVCRYRDARNSKAATSRNFHDDDDLDSHVGGISLISLHKKTGCQLQPLTLVGSSTSSMNTPTGQTSAYYDAARDDYRR